MTAEEIKEKLIGLALLVIVGIWGKQWRKNLTDWAKNKIVNFILNIGKNWKRSWVLTVFNIIFRPLRTAFINKTTSEIHYYQVDQIRIYFFITGTKNAYFDFYGADKMDLFLEVTREGYLICPDNPIKMSALAPILKELQEVGFIHIPCIDEIGPDHEFVAEIMRAENVKSSYMELFFDEKGGPVIVAVMNSTNRCVKISDFTRFRGTFRELAIEFGQIKPRK